MFLCPLMQEVPDVDFVWAHLDEVPKQGFGAKTLEAIHIERALLELMCLLTRRFFSTACFVVALVFAFPFAFTFALTFPPHLSSIVGCIFEVVVLAPHMSGHP